MSSEGIEIMSVDAALNDVSRSLGVPSDWLRKLIQFESGFNPFAKNPFSSATGLIQFTDSTARSLGYGSANELVVSHPTVESQLRGPVLRYLLQFAPFDSKQSLYLSVFYPAFRKYPLNAEFPDSVKTVNPGIKYVGDYIAKVERKSFKKYSAIGFFIPIVAAALAVFFPQLKRRWTDEGKI